jgi:outer membrane protein OmpA-like peptidoglycan-associated protein
MKKLIKLLILTIFLTGNLNAQVTNLGENVNSIYDEIRPLVSADGNTLFFIVEGNPLNPYKDGQDVWFSKKTDSGTWGKSTRLPNNINGDRYNAIYWCSKDGNKLLIKGNYGSLNGKPKKGLSMVYKNDSGWSEPKNLIVNDYSKISRGIYNGVTLSPDEKVMILYFSTETNEVYNDLWVSFLDTTTMVYSTPVKLPISQDDYDEISPYIAQDGKTLYYSTNNLNGIGKYDIWMTKRLNSSWLNWSSPVNIDTPFNSKEWDAYLSIGEDRKTAYFSRSKGKNIDIYSDTLQIIYRPETPIEIKKDTTFIHDTTIVTNVDPCNEIDTMSNEQLINEIERTKILFDFGSSALRSDAYKKLDYITRLMNKNPNMVIELSGHSDAIGNPERNLKQSKQRALSAKEYLISRGINPNRISAKGYSNSKPVIDNMSEEGRQLNRRVDIKVLIN